MQAEDYNEREPGQNWRGTWSDYETNRRAGNTKQDPIINPTARFNIRWQLINKKLNRIVI